MDQRVQSPEFLCVAALELAAAQVPGAKPHQGFLMPSQAFLLLESLSSDMVAGILQHAVEEHGGVALKRLLPAVGDIAWQLTIEDIVLQ